MLDIYVDLGHRLGAAASSGTEAEAASAVAGIAVDAIPGVEQASVSCRVGDRFRTLASTGDSASEADRIQYDLGSGPCLDAITREAIYCSGNVARDSRWRDFGTRAPGRTGILSVLALRLFVDESPGHSDGLNLYSAQPDAFDDVSEMIGTVLATHCALALTAAAARDKAANLHRALVSNRRIGMAIGILMSQNKINEDDAFTLLRIVSQHTNRKLLDIAGEVLVTGTLELPASTAPRRRRHRTPISPRSAAQQGGAADA
jgi:ANTAR domain/GAF domain